MGTKSDANHVRPSSVPAGQDDRRGSSRYTVVEDQAWLGWWEGATYVTAPCRILDLSIRGALVELETLPSLERSVWFCPPETATAQWLEATLVQRQRQENGLQQARIAFQRILPYDTFKALVYGRPTPVSVEVAACWRDPDDVPAGR